jgi:predicted nucleotidyltransferase
MLDDARIAWLRRLLDDGPTPLFATVSGAHLYGFESADSDWDLRGAFVAPLRSVIGLREFDETFELHGERDGEELDWVAHDVRKFAQLMTRRNGYVLEQLYSPLVVHGGAWLEELRAIGAGCITKHLVHHYLGFAHNQRELLEGNEPTVKRLLYCQRVYLTGIHVLATGRIESNLVLLAEAHGIDTLAGLIERKRAGAEQGRLAAGESEGARAALDTLDLRLHDAHARSRLPDEVQSLAALDDFVVRARMELGRG